MTGFKLPKVGIEGVQGGRGGEGVGGTRGHSPRCHEAMRLIWLAQGECHLLGTHILNHILCPFNQISCCDLVKYHDVLFIWSDLNMLLLSCVPCRNLLLLFCSNQNAAATTSKVQCL